MHVSGAQVIAIGNAFELVYQSVESYGNLPGLAVADERHFGQKSAFWSTQHGWPDVVITTSKPSTEILEAIYVDHQPPSFIEPQRTSSAICLDLLADSASWRALISLLNRDRKVFLAPYVHSTHVDTLAAKLISEGFTLCDYKPQAPLVRQLWSKVYAQANIFEQIVELHQHRPKSLVATSTQSLRDVARHFSQEGIRELVVKSSSAVGGSGIFFVDSTSLSRQNVSIDHLLRGRGQNCHDRTAPFLVEEYVQWDISPTIDIEVMSSGQIKFVGLALQRLHDRRYYTGFYASPVLEDLWWSKQTLRLATIIGRKLSSLGYAGPANIDFAVTAATQKITLIELNPRRSALLDGFGIRKMMCGEDDLVSISVADYVNVSPRFHTFTEASKELEMSPGVILPVADGGFLSDFRWAGIWAAGSADRDSEFVLESAVMRLQDPECDEIGSAGPPRFSRIREDAA